MTQPKKHHYIPVFYLKRWAAELGKIVEFSRPHRGIVKPLRKHPDGTGYVHRLYEIEGVPPEQAQQFEELFMSPVDNLAADALCFMEAGFLHDNEWSSERRSAWSRFILSLLLRTPEDIAQLKALVADDWGDMMAELQEKYERDRAPNDPFTIQEYMAENDISQEPEFAMSIARNLIGHGRIGRLINDWFWGTIDVSASGIELLTSDRPVLMSGSLGEPQAYIIMPIGPELLFVASNDHEAVRTLQREKPIDLVKKTNSFVVAHAVKYVYGRSDRQLRFVQNRMSTILQSSLLERTARFRAGRVRGNSARRNG